MNELEQIFTEMLNHIDDHKEAYDKPQWTNEAIVKTWIKTNESKLKILGIGGVVKSFTAKQVADMLFKDFSTVEQAIHYFDNLK